MNNHEEKHGHHHHHKGMMVMCLAMLIGVIAINTYYQGENRTWLYVLIFGAHIIIMGMMMKGHTGRDHEEHEHHVTEKKDDPA